MTRPRLIFVNRFFYPDESATAQILADVTEALAALGWPVEVITSRKSYSDATVSYPSEDDWQGVKIHRIATTGFGRGNIFGRLIDYLSFYVSCWFSLLKRVRRGDILIVKTDPPLISVPAGLVARLKGARQVNWLQDLYPEVAEALEVKAIGPLSGLMRWLRNRSLRRAEMNVAIGQRMAERLRGNGVAPARVMAIHNFTDDEALAAAHGDPDGLRADWGYRKDDFIVGYSGNLGRAHDVETVLAAAQQLRGERHIRFLFIGGGHLKAQVEAAADRLDLTSVMFQPYQPRDQLAVSLRAPDVHWVSLQPALEGLIVPSKLYGIVGVGRPLIMIGDVEGEIGRLAAQYGFGETLAMGEDAALADLIKALAADRARLEKMGEAGLRFIAEEGSRGRAIRMWDEMLTQLVAGQSSP